MGEDGDMPSNPNLVKDNDYENFGWVNIQISNNVKVKEFNVKARLTGSTQVGKTKKSKTVDL